MRHTRTYAAMWLEKGEEDAHYNFQQSNNRAHALDEETEETVKTHIIGPASLAFPCNRRVRAPSINAHACTPNTLHTATNRLGSDPGLLWAGAGRWQIAGGTLIDLLVFFLEQGEGRAHRPWAQRESVGTVDEGGRHERITCGPKIRLMRARGTAHLDELAPSCRMGCICGG